jgi:general secretion pathway protein J
MSARAPGTQRRRARGRARAVAGRCRGFTLIELLVAIFIAAVIFALGYGGVSQGLREQAALAKNQQRLTAVQTAVRLMVQDFSQLAQRPIRDPLGASMLPAIQSNSQASTGAQATSVTSGFSNSSPSAGSASGSTGLGGFSTISSSQTPAFVVFTRMGWANPAGIQRPALERVQYVIENGVLRRENWRVLDPTLDDLPVPRKLLDHVRGVKLRYMDQARVWHDDWPVPNTIQGTPGVTLRQRPIAIEVTLDLEDYGVITRVIEVPG